MENITVATAPTTGSHPRAGAVAAALRAAELMLKGVRAFGSGMFDPMTCSAYWVVASPYAWAGKK